MKYEFKILEKINQNNVSVYMPQIYVYDVEAASLAKNIIHCYYPIEYLTDKKKSTPFRDGVSHRVYGLPSMPHNAVQYVNSYTEAENICRKFQELIKSYIIVETKTHNLTFNGEE